MLKSLDQNSAKNISDISIKGPANKWMTIFFSSVLHIEFLGYLGFVPCDKTQIPVYHSPIHFQHEDWDIELLVHYYIFTCMAEPIQQQLLIQKMNYVLGLSTSYLHGGFCCITPWLRQSARKRKFGHKKPTHTHAHAEGSTG